MAEDVVDCLNKDGYESRLFNLIFCAGGTDAAEATRANIKATTVKAISTAIFRDGLVYHTPHDMIEAIEIDVVEACLRLVTRYLELLELRKSRG